MHCVRPCMRARARDRGMERDKGVCACEHPDPTHACTHVYAEQCTRRDTARARAHGRGHGHPGTGNTPMLTVPRAPGTHLRNELADTDARRAICVTPLDHLANTLLDLSVVCTRHTPATSRVCWTPAPAPRRPPARRAVPCVSARRAPPCACPDSLALGEDRHRREARRLHERHDVLCAGRAAAHERARFRCRHSPNPRPFFPLRLLHHLK